MSTDWSVSIKSAPIEDATQKLRDSFQKKIASLELESTLAMNEFLEAHEKQTKEMHEREKSLDREIAFVTGKRDTLRRRLDTKPQLKEQRKFHPQITKLSSEQLRTTGGLVIPEHGI